MFQSPLYGSPWRQIDPDLGVENPDLLYLLDLWSRQRGGADVPHRSSVTPFDLKPLLGWIILVDAEAEPERYRFRLIGSAITQLLNRDSTGCYLDELFTPKIYEEFCVAYRYVGAQRQPARCEGRLVQAGKDYLTYESVILPYADDDARIGLYLEAIRLVQSNAA